VASGKRDFRAAAEFRSVGRIPLRLGWKAVYQAVDPDAEVEAEQTLPPLSDGETASLSDAWVEAKRTARFKADLRLTLDQEKNLGPIQAVLHDMAKRRADRILKLHGDRAAATLRLRPSWPRSDAVSCRLRAAGLGRGHAFRVASGVAWAQLQSRAQRNPADQSAAPVIPLRSHLTSASSWKFQPRSRHRSSRRGGFPAGAAAGRTAPCGCGSHIAAPSNLNASACSGETTARAESEQRESRPPAPSRWEQRQSIGVNLA